MENVQLVIVEYSISFRYLTNYMSVLILCNCKFGVAFRVPFHFGTSLCSPLLNHKGNIYLFILQVIITNKRV